MISYYNQNMKKRLIFFSKFNNSPYFTKENTDTIAKESEIIPDTLNSYITRSIQDGNIIQLKRNYYVHRDYFEENKNKLGYKLYLANKLLNPSYISLETALAYYDLLTEGISTIVSSITLKIPREYINYVSHFQYKSIKEDIFNGYQIADIDGYNITIAKPYKAVIDFIYFKSDQFRTIQKGMIEELRINIENFDNENKIEFQNSLTTLNLIDRI